MKLITKKNLSLVLALMMAVLIISSAKANSKIDPKKRTAVFVHSAELVAYVDTYFDEMEMNLPIEEETKVKLFDKEDQLIFSGLIEDMDEEIAQQYHQSEFLSEMAGAEYYKILH